MAHMANYSAHPAGEYQGTAMDVSIAALLFPLIVGGLLLFDALN